MYTSKGLKTLNEFRAYAHRFPMPTRIEAWMRATEVYTDYYLAFNDVDDAYDEQTIHIYAREWSTPKGFVYVGTLSKLEGIVRYECLMYLKGVVLQIKQGAA